MATDVAIIMTIKQTRNDFVFIGFGENSQNYTPEIGQSCSILPHRGRDKSPEVEAAAVARGFRLLKAAFAKGSAVAQAMA